MRETDLSGDGESVARRFARWLGQTSLPWLMVLEDLRDMTALDELWPSGPAGRVLVTTADPAPFSGELKALVYPVGLYRPAEAQSYLAARLGPRPVPGRTGTGRRPRVRAAGPGPGQRGHRELGTCPAGTTVTCSPASVSRPRPASGSPAAGAVTWAISAEQADRLAPRHRAGPALARRVPRRPRDSLAVFGTPAACAHITGGDASLTPGRRGPCPRGTARRRAGGPAGVDTAAGRGAGPDEPGGPGGGAGGTDRRRCPAGPR